MILNRALGKEERVGDFSIAGALRDHPKDFEFASGKISEKPVDWENRIFEATWNPALGQAPPAPKR